jgi:hypothetical protein
MPCSVQHAHQPIRLRLGQGMETHRTARMYHNVWLGVSKLTITLGRRDESWT